MNESDYQFIQICSLCSASAKFITGRNEVLAKVIFLHLSVILFTGGGAPDIALIWGGAPEFAQIFRGGIFLGGVPPNFRGGVLQIFGGGRNFGGGIFGGGSSKFSGGVFFLGGVPPNFRGGFLQIFLGGGFSTGIRSTFGRYASYWNAFLFSIKSQYLLLQYT